MLSKYIKDKHLRNLFCKIELKRKITKFLFIRLLNFPNVKTKRLFLNYSSLDNLYKKKKKLALTTKISNRCVVTNRNRGVIKAYSISRLKFLELCRFGIIPGYIKAVW